MSSLVAAVTSAWNSAVGAVMKLLGVIGATVGGWLSALGAKLLSVQWIKSICDFFKKVVDTLKKTVFNDKVVKIMKLVLTLALFGLAAAQTVLSLKVFFGNVSDAFQFGGEYIVFFVLMCAAAAFLLFSLILFVWRFLKKKFDFTFVAALFYFYLIAAFCHAMTGLLYYRDLVNSFDALKIALIVIFFITALIKLIDRENPTSGVAFLLCAVGLLVAYLVFKSEGFAKIAQFTFGSELALDSKNVGFITYFRQMSFVFAETPELPSVAALEIVRLGLSLSATSGSFAAALVAAFNGFIFFVSEIAPYLLMTAFIGFAMAMLNDRPKQVSYLAKTLKRLKYLFFGLLVALLAAWITTFFYREGQMVSMSLCTGSAILSILAAVALAVLCAASRKLVGDKGANPYRPEVKKK